MGKSRLQKAVKEFWEDIGGMNDVDEIADVNMSVSTRDMRELDDVLRMAASLEKVPYQSDQ